MARRNRSANARRLQRYNDNMMIGRIQPRRVTGVTDWIVSSASVDSTGAPITSGGLTSWNGQKTIASGSITSQAVVVQPTPAASTPSVGRLRVDQIRGRILVTLDPSDVVSSLGGVAVGIYVSDLNNTTTLWNVRDLSVPADACRDDYLYLEGKVWAQAPSTPSSPVELVCFDLSISQPVVIGGGQALHVTVSLTGGSKLVPQLTDIFAFFRTRVGPVA